MKYLIAKVSLACFMLWMGIFSVALASPAIVVNLPSCTLALFNDVGLVKVYPVAIGSPATPTPQGSFKIFYKEVNPVWYPPGQGYSVASGPQNPLGYRWMEFFPEYGIHGTNRPNSIGSAVSNGCIRMNESDVEDIFEQVPLGTPVTITYDRVQVRLDAARQVSVGVYPDVYGLGAVTVGDVQKQLAQYDIVDFMSEEQMAQLVNDVSSTQVAVASLYDLKVNDSLLTDKVVVAAGKVYIPVDSVATALKQTFLFDENNHLLKIQDKIVPGVRRGNHIYATEEDVQTLFGCRVILNSEKQQLNIQTMRVIVNNKQFIMDIQQVGPIWALPIEDVAESLGAKLLYQGGTFKLPAGGPEIPIAWFHGRPYIQINKINEFFGAYVYYNEQALAIEIINPAP